MMKKELGQRIKKLRQDKGLSIYQMSKMLGVSPKSIEGWENGKVRMRLVSLIKLVNFFEVSVDFLLGLKD